MNTGWKASKNGVGATPCIMNRVAPEIEEAVVTMFMNPWHRRAQVRATNEPRKIGILVSSGGVRSIWSRNNLASFRKRRAVHSARTKS